MRKVGSFVKFDKGEIVTYDSKLKRYLAHKEMKGVPIYFPIKKFKKSKFFFFKDDHISFDYNDPCRGIIYCRLDSKITLNQFENFLERLDTIEIP